MFIAISKGVVKKGSFGVFVGKLKYGKSMNKFKEFAMITD